MRRITLFVFILILLSDPVGVLSAPMSLFPIEHYNQRLEQLPSLQIQNASKTLLTTPLQKEHFSLFLSRYVGSRSPWSALYLKRLWCAKKQACNEIKQLEKHILQLLGHPRDSTQKSYGENFRVYSSKWFEQLEREMRLEQFSHLKYDKGHRAIITINTMLRTLPTNEVLFHDPKRAGEGYPFDYLQMKSLFVGIPVYVLGETRDHAWSLVVTPELIGWVKQEAIALVSSEFVQKWRRASYQHLLACCHTKIPMQNAAGKFLGYAYVGMVLPGAVSGKKILLMWPRSAGQGAHIQLVHASKDWKIAPWSLTPLHLKKILKTLIGRPYGWGGAYFYNDCSLELKYLFTPFGIWLPNLSYQQILVGKIKDLSYASKSERLVYLKKRGKPFLTLIYVGGHIMLYVGKIRNSHVPVVYQNVWGLHPVDNSWRAVIGKSVLLPLLVQYPEDERLLSQAAMPYFVMSDLTHITKEAFTFLPQQVE